MSLEQLTSHVLECSHCKKPHDGLVFVQIGKTKLTALCPTTAKVITYERVLKYGL